MQRYFNKLFVVVLSASLGVTSVYAQELDEIEFEGDMDVPVMITPTRLKQSRHDIPAAVSRIEAKDLQALQVRTIPEALNYVAGMAVGYASGNQPRVNYHGTNGLVPRRMQVLLDGMSVYRAGYAEVTWPVLPITIEDIWAIEVTRSPSSPTYGQNAMMAVINIITKNPVQEQGAAAKVRAGGNETRDAHVSIGGSPTEKFSYRLSLSNTSDEGYDTNFVGEERRDGSDINKLYARASYKVGDSSDLNFIAGYSDGVTELEFRDADQLTFPDIDNTHQYYQAEFTHAFSPRHDIQIKTYFAELEQDLEWSSCKPQALYLPSLRALELQNPDYAHAIVAQQMPSGGTPEDDLLALQVFQDVAALGASAYEPTCGTGGEDAVETKFNLEVQDTYIVSDDFRFVFGGAVNQQKLDSKTFVNGTVDIWGGNIFGNAEYRVGKLVINAGALIEDEEQHLDHPEVSPRLGFNYRISPDNTIRYAVSRAVRVPDILEMDRDWSYYLTGLTPAVNGETELPFFHRAVADGDLDPEEIISHEIGLYGFHANALSDGGSSEFQYDVKIFHDEMTKLISEKLQFFDYDPTNNTENTLTGFEFEVDYTVRGGFLPDAIKQMKLHANYAYLDSDTNNFFELSLYARHNGALYTILNFNRDYYMSLAYYGNSAINGESFDGFELGAGKLFKFGGSELELSAKAVYWPDKVNEFTVSETFNVENINEQSTTAFVSARYTF